mgnify:CR=1 FL=1
MTGSIFHFLVSGAFLKILPDRIFVHIVSDKHSLAGVFLFCAGDAVAVIGDIKLEKLVSGCELSFCTDDISKRSANDLFQKTPQGFRCLHSDIFEGEGLRHLFAALRILYFFLIPAAQQQALAKNRQRCVRLTAALDAMSPLKVLTRGYAMAQNTQGQILKSWRDVSAGDAVTVTLGEGALECRVEDAYDTKERYGK